MKQKSAGTTLLLNILLPGAGHIYASDGERWGLLAVNLTCAITGTFLVLPWVGNVICWILAPVQSSSITEEYNRRSLDAEEDALREEQDRRREAAEAKAAAEARAEANQAHQEETRAIDERRVTGEALARQLARLHALESTGVISDDELLQELRKITAKSVGGWTEESLADFLGPFAEMVQAGTITTSTLTTVKAIYAALQKHRPQASAR